MTFLVTFFFNCSSALTNFLQSVARANADFSKSYLFDLRTGRFDILRNDGTSQHPRLTKLFSIRNAQPPASSFNEYLFVTIERQQHPNMFPQSPTEANSLYVGPEVRIWMAGICDHKRRTEQNGNSSVPPNETCSKYVSECKLPLHPSSLVSC